MMLFRCSLISALFLTMSGCTLTSQHQHQETLDKIDHVAAQTNQQQQTLSTSLSNHDDALSRLSDKISAIESQLKVMQRTQAKVYANMADAKPEVKVKEKVVRVPVNDDKVLLGAREWVWFDAVESTFQARVDTGAETSSLNAVDIQEFERDGDTWVKFNVNHSENNDEPVFMEMPVKRWVRIRQSSTDKTDRRPVVEAWIRVGSIHEKTQFTLADRTNMEYPVLLGREFFKDLAVVDVSQEHIHPKYEPETQPDASSNDANQK
ncbi:MULTISPECIES: ATP-dependent zinc protease family protein [unclassified Salinivibrio]|uniref:ATP-dependent zinc protease family protein n=2 Tax=Gammaproteobacteria TaxID=1236 RepID=UPI001F51D9BC|nr:MULTISPECIES: ATP-dependent zinc protease [unclassified Salinivibrio]